MRRAAAMAAMVTVVVVVGMVGWVEGAAPTQTRTWCIARSGVGATTLQAALDYACGSGVADCAPVLPGGICYLPNTLSSHTSYAFNSYYQRSSAAPGACDFAGTATVTVTDPSYGSCSYPSSASTAGGSIGTTPNNNPSGTPMTTFTPPTSGGGDNIGGSSPPAFGSSIPDDNDIDTSITCALHPLEGNSFLLLIFDGFIAFFLIDQFI